jgi:hypothetical protein
MKAEQIMKAMRKPAPWTVTDAKVMAGPERWWSWFRWMAALISEPPKGAVSNMGYAGNLKLVSKKPLGREQE